MILLSSDLAGFLARGREGLVAFHVDVLVHRLGRRELDPRLVDQRLVGVVDAVEVARAHVRFVFGVAGGRRREGRRQRRRR